MTMLYSPAAGGFFDPALDYPGGLPADAVEISAAKHAQLLAGQAAGRAIRPGKGGKPVLADRIPLRAELAAAVRREATRRIAAIAPVWRQLNDLREPTPASAARFAAIDAVRAASALIEQDLTETDTTGLLAFPVADHPAWPALPANPTANLPESN